MSGPEGTPNGADRLAQIEDWRKEGTLGQISVSDVLALVEIARAAREAVNNVRVVLPSVGSDQNTVMALVEEWQDAAVSVADLDAALARLDSGAAEENA